MSKAKYVRSAFDGIGSKAAGAKRSGQLMQKLGLETTAEGLAALRTKSADEIVTAAQGGDDLLLFVPSVDGWVFPKLPAQVFTEGQQHHVPLLLGSTVDEYTPFLPFTLLPADVEGYHKWVHEQEGEQAEAALRLYPVKTAEDIPSAAVQLLTDKEVTTIAVNLARAMAKVNTQAFLYHFTAEYAGSGGATLGAFHAMELQFVFHNFILPLDADMYPLVEAVSGYWVQFATTGNPNRQGLPTWPAYDQEDGRHDSSERYRRAADLPR